MKLLFPFFQLSAGIGLFLFGMYLIEEALKNISGRNFKLFLQRITKNRFGAVAGGAIVTAVLQSSSMVSLMVLAFVGAGVFTMKNAIAIILGANLGTTLDSWVVATLGFKVNIEIAAYPALFVGGILLILVNNRRAAKYTAYFLLGFGLLFIGLAYMKTAMESQVKEFDFSHYAQLPLPVFLLIGFIITMLVQSSSVTMALTLSALHSGAIGFAPATAIVLGSETGTTIKIGLSALGGNASKKRVALGNFLFNVFLTLFAFALLRPILYLITDIFKIHDPLIGLVTFSSLTNLLSIVIFLPLLTPFTKLLERFFKNTDATLSAFIGHANAVETQTALDLFRRETEFFMHNSMLFNLSQFEIDTTFIEEHPVFKEINKTRKFDLKTPEDKYEFIRQWQGEIQSFYLDLRTKLEGADSEQLNRLISAVRSSMYAVKSIKDIGGNISNLQRSSKDIKYEFFIHHKKETESLYRQLDSLFKEESKGSFPLLQSIYNTVHTNYTTALNSFYNEASEAPLEDLDITTIINFNRELFTSNKAMLMAIKDFVLEEAEAEKFNEIPEYQS
ncbi:MAG TPA: Na/Pi symporter [Chitinophagales bacterium]|nr:Na/Pi symporter [Chitinophagales bacterium]